ncbi:Protein of unknown function (DUF2434) domain containing protein [Hyaloscypha variabilis]
MAVLDFRELLATRDFPPGDNSSDTLIAGEHFNLMTLNYWNFTYYSNGTFSNGSSCFLAFEPYTPQLLSNGTFLNATSCYSPINPMHTRAKAGLFFACFFALSIMFTMVNLRKHGKLFLPREKRFHAIGRRWQWYWMLVVAVFGIISAFTGVDVDRYYVPEIPIVLTNFFWFLMLPTTMCIVWESVRHWGSWQERQLVDPDPFTLRQDDRRSKIEFWMPLVFYFFAWMNIFMAIPRPWGAIELQRDPDQMEQFAEPAATDIRFKLAALFLFGAWLTTAFSLWHSIKHYKPRNRGFFNRAVGFIGYLPPTFLLTLSLSLVMIGYEAACAFDFSKSPLKVDTNLGFMYGLGWGPIAMIIVVQEVRGYPAPNDDRELIRQRRIRGTAADQEMGMTKKPHWWSRVNTDKKQLNVQESGNVSEIGGGRPRTRNLERNIEMGNMPVSSRRERNKPAPDIAVRAASNLLFPARTGTEETQERFTDHPEQGRGRVVSNAMADTKPSTNNGANDRTDSNYNTANGSTLGAGTQQFRSMLDI